ncbi:MAG: DUF111 family protein, partial [Planctomycetes bacterium]|nr:DUF111 family protein [Planctomycetota bacterium]
PGNVDQAQRIIFTETTTFGVRRGIHRRSKLQRRRQSVETQYGAIHIKIGSLGNEILTASPEFSDCLSAAQSHHVALKEVLRAATAAYHQEAGQ